MSSNEVRTSDSRPDAAGRWTLASWLMLPLLIPSFVLTFVLAAVLLGTAGLEGSEPMSEQGAIGWIVVVLGLILVPLPAYLGTWFAIKARRLGERAPAAIAMGLNLLVIVAFWVLTVATTLDQM